MRHAVFAVRSRQTIETKFHFIFFVFKIVFCKDNEPCSLSGVLFLLKALACTFRILHASFGMLGNWRCPRRTLLSGVGALKQLCRKRRLSLSNVHGAFADRW